MQQNQSLPVPDFRQLVESLCRAASADHMAAQARLEDLQRHLACGSQNED